MESSFPRESLESSANKLEELIRKSAKLVTDTMEQNKINWIDMSSEIKENSKAEIFTQIFRIKVWKSAVDELMNLLDAMSLLDWINQEVVLDELSYLKSSCHDYLSQTRSDL